MPDSDELPRRAAAALAFCGRPVIWLENVEVVEVARIVGGGWLESLLTIEAALRPNGPRYVGKTCHPASPEYVRRKLSLGHRVMFVMTGTLPHPQLGVLCMGSADLIKTDADRANAEEIRRMTLSPGGAATYAEIMG